MAPGGAAAGAAPVRRLRTLLRRPRPDYVPDDASIAGQAVVVTAGVFVQGLARFGYSLVIGSVLGSGALGTVGPAIALITFLATLWPTSASNAASKYIAAARGRGDMEETRAVARYLDRTVLVAVAALVVVGAAWTVIALHGSWATAAWVAALTAGYSGYCYVRGVLFGTGRSTSAAVWDVLTSVISLTLLALVVAGRVEALLLAPLTTGYLVYTAFNWPALGKRPVRALEPRRREEIASFVRWGALSSAAASGTLQLTQILAPLWSGAHEVGLYTAAASLATPAAMLVGAVYLVLFPSLAHAHGAGALQTLRTQVDVATRALIVILTAILGTVAVLARPLLGLYSLLGSHDYSGSVPLLRILVIGVLVANVGAPGVAFISSTTARGIRVVAALNVIAVTVSAALTVILSPHVGVYGSAVAYAVGGAVVGLSPVVIVWRRVGLRFGGLVARFLVAVVALIALTVALPSAGVALSIALAVGFLAVWAALEAGDIRLVLRHSPRLQVWAGKLRLRRPGS